MPRHAARWIGVALAFLFQFAAIAYWGGSTRADLVSLSKQFEDFAREARITEARHSTAIEDLRIRVSVREAIGDTSGECTVDG